MEFGRIEITNETDLALPSDHPENQKVLSQNKNGKTEVFVGLPITSHPKWISTIYPPKPKNDLLHFGNQFGALEANSTGYGAPSAATIQKWIIDTPEDFKFCPKIPQNISRSANLMNTIPATESFCESMKLLGNKLGMCFLQMSDTFAPKRFNDISNYLEAFPKDVPLAVELRHEEWFSNKSAFDEISEAMQKNNITFIITDSAGRRDALHQRLTNSTAFIRFNGYNLHPTDFPRMDEWVLRLKSWIDSGIKSIYFFVHTDEKELNPFLSNYMIEKLNEKCNLNLKLCRFIDEDKLRPKK